jgi:hypothetical protein
MKTSYEQFKEDLDKAVWSKEFYFMLVVCAICIVPWVAIPMVTIAGLCYLVGKDQKPTAITPEQQEKLNKIYKETYKSWSK